MRAEMMRIYKGRRSTPSAVACPSSCRCLLHRAYWCCCPPSRCARRPGLAGITTCRCATYFILPLIMLAANLFQVWLNPPAADLMAEDDGSCPSCFGIMFFAFLGAGALLGHQHRAGIAQQWLINGSLGELSHWRESGPPWLGASMRRRWHSIAAMRGAATAAEQGSRELLFRPPRAIYPAGGFAGKPPFNGLAPSPADNRAPCLPPASPPPRPHRRHRHGARAWRGGHPADPSPQPLDGVIDAVGRPPPASPRGHFTRRCVTQRARPSTTAWRCDLPGAALTPASMCWSCRRMAAVVLQLLLARASLRPAPARAWPSG